ncbi:unnamed protein product [Ixodes persulcatus]
MDLLSSATQRLIVNLTPRTSRAAPGGGTACIPYMHNARDLTRSVKSLASRYGTKVIFRCRFRLGSMCKLVTASVPPPPPLQRVQKKTRLSISSMRKGKGILDSLDMWRGMYRPNRPMPERSPPRTHRMHGTARGVISRQGSPGMHPTV